MLLTKFYKYATEYPWFIRLNLIVGYIASWVGFVASLLLLLIVPSMPGYEAALIMAVFGVYFYVLLRMRRSMKIEPETIAQMKVDAGVTSILNQSLKKLL